MSTGSFKTNVTYNLVTLTNIIYDIFPSTFFASPFIHNSL